MLADPEPDGFVRRPEPLLPESGYHLSSCRATSDLDRPAASQRVGGLQPLDEPSTSIRRPFPRGIHDRVDVFRRWPNHGLSPVHDHKPSRRENPGREQFFTAAENRSRPRFTRPTKVSGSGTSRRGFVPACAPDSSLNLPDSSQARPIRPCPCPIRHIFALRCLTVLFGVVESPRSFLPPIAPAGVRS